MTNEQKANNVILIPSTLAMPMRFVLIVLLAVVGCGEADDSQADRRRQQLAAGLGPTLDPDKPIEPPQLIERPPLMEPPTPSAEALDRLLLNPTGRWRRGSLKGQLDIRPWGDQWRVDIAAHAPWRGDATPSPCEMTAIGRLRGKRLEALVQTTFVYPEEDFEPQINIVFDGRRAEVQELYTTGVCGMHSYVGGTYVRE